MNNRNNRTTNGILITLELKNYTTNENYGRVKCFDCLVEPKGDDPIFIGINRLILKGLGTTVIKLIVSVEEFFYKPDLSYRPLPL